MILFNKALIWGIEARTGELNHPSLLPLAPFPVVILEMQTTPGLHLQTPQNLLSCKEFVLLQFWVPRGSFWLQKFPVFWSQNRHEKSPKYLAALCSTHGFVFFFFVPTSLLSKEEGNLGESGEITVLSFLGPGARNRRL